MARELPTLDRLIMRMAASVEEMFTDENGAIDRHAMTAYVRDHFKEDYPDAVDYYHDEAGWKYVWEIIRKNYSGAKSGIDDAEDESGQFRLMPLEELDKYVFNIPSGPNEFETKRFPVCSVQEARAVGYDYIQKSRRLAQIGRWALAYADEAERRGLPPNALIRDLYRAA